MTERCDIATEKFSEGYNCAQSVFYSFCDLLGFDKDLGLKMVCGLGAGMARKQEVCGAVTGAIIVIGTKYGRGETETRDATEVTYKKTRELMDRFAEKHGSVICSRLINGCELTTEQGQNEFKEKDLLNTICKPCVRSVVEILEPLMS